MGDEVYARNAVEVVLERAHKAGDSGVSATTLQEQVAIGGGDLETVLGVMIEEGAVRREEEDPEPVYEFVPEEERVARDLSELAPDDPDRVAAEAEDGRVVDISRPVAGAPGPAADLRTSAGAVGVAATTELVGGPVIRLTRGMIGAMSDAALGEVVKAAVTEHQESGASTELTIAIA